MKSILLSGTAALLLVAASGAYAQQDQHQNDNHPGNDQHMSGPADQRNTAGDHNNNGSDHGSNGPANTTTTHTTTHRTRNRHHTTTHTTSTTTTNDNDHSNNGFDHNGNNNNNNNDHDNNGHDNNGDHNNNNSDHNNNGHPHAQISVNLRITVNAPRHFRGPAWHAPSGYRYRRYGIGQRLEPAFYARDYWLTDYATYDLIAPPDGYTWVRFGPDAILIDEDTGEVVRVVYGVFI